MKYIFSFLLCFCINSNGNGQPVEMHGQLKVAGTKVLDKNNDTFALHGMSFGWSCFHPRFYTAGSCSIHLHKDWNCNVVSVRHWV